MKTNFSFLLILVICLFTATNSSTAQDLNPRTTLIPVADLQEDLATFKENLELIHAGLYTFTPKEKMDARFAEISAEITAPMTSQDFYRKLITLNTDIRNGHTNIIPHEAFGSTEKLLPLEVYWDEEKLYILRNNSNDPSLSPGTRIDSINGEAAATVFYELADLFPRDGYNTSFPEAITYRAFNEFYISFKAIPDVYDLVVTSSGGAARNIHLPAMEQDTYYANRTARYGDIHYYWEKGLGDPMTLAIEGNTATITIKTCGKTELTKFGNSIGKQVDRYFEAIEAAGVEHLIIDIRSNGGGSQEISVALLRHLSPEPFELFADNYLIVNKIPNRKLYNSNTFFLNLMGGIGLKKGEDGNYRNRKVIDWVYNTKTHTQPIAPAATQFKGQVYCIGDGYSFSAAGQMASWLKTYTNCLFVGEEIGGAETTLTAGEYVELELPNSGVRAILPVVFEELHNPRGQTGHGVQPDFPIRNSIQDLINGHDAIMEFTIQHIAGADQTNKEAGVAKIDR
ncbi:MAG: S41 family peptidase [Lewinella sp.]